MQESCRHISEMRDPQKCGLQNPPDNRYNQIKKGAAKVELLTISGCDKTDRELDLLFVHGLDGDGRSTWQTNNKPDSFWPDWLGNDFPKIGVWSLDYDVSSTAWKGHTMPLYDRARDCLDRFDLAEIGHRPIGFVCHSLGGLLVKQILRLANESKNASWRGIAQQTRFIVFLSTPHSGADMANWINHLSTLLRSSVSIKELEAHNPELLQLNTWYRDHAGDIKTSVYCEKRPTHGILVVNESSADPGIPGVTPIPQDADHITICKPANKNASVYLRVKRLIQSTLEEQHNGDQPMLATSKSATYSGKIKTEFCDRLGDDWRILADYLEIKSSEKNRWDRGLEARAIWEWLERRKRLEELPGILQDIDRNDLATVFSPPR